MSAAVAASTGRTLASQRSRFARDGASTTIHPSPYRRIVEGGVVPYPARSPSSSSSRRSVSTLILLRHGQSEWNGPKARFTGWCDVPLTVRGRVEAVAAGQLMRSRGFNARRVCVAFASELQRSHETCELSLASMAGECQESWSSDRIRRDWRLNERHYGAVQGRHKGDPDLEATYGAETLRRWRRSMNCRSPPMDPTHEHWRPPPAPLTESLADCQRRVVDCFEDTIAPALFDEEGLPLSPDERAVIVVAHSNTIRSLMAHFDDVCDEKVTELYVPNSVPILYRFDCATRKPVSIKLSSAAGGSHARWMLSAGNHRAVRGAISEGGALTRALFDAMRGGARDSTLTGRQVHEGVRQLTDGEDGGTTGADCVVISVAREIARELAPDDEIHIRDFERMTREAYEGLQLAKSLNIHGEVPLVTSEYVHLVASP